MTDNLLKVRFERDENNRKDERGKYETVEESGEGAREQEAIQQGGSMNTPIRTRKKKDMWHRLK